MIGAEVPPARQIIKLIADYDYNVDVLITGYHHNYGKNAIRLSGVGNRSDFLGDISLTSGDNVIITNLGGSDGLGNMVNVISGYHPTIYNSNNFEYATVKITGDGTIAVSQKEPI